MKAFDFEYDGVKLSDMGYMICRFGGEGDDTIATGSQITMNTVPVLYGRKHEFISSGYDSYIEATFQICKKICDGSELYEISVNEERQLMRWLNRMNYHKMVFLGDEYKNYYFEATFNLASIVVNGVVCGIQLTMMTNRPYAIQDYVIRAEHTNESTTIYYNDVDTETTTNNAFYLGIISDDEGILYPKKVEITCGSDGDLDIYNQTAGRHTIIKNCANGEVITLDYPVITSSYADHAIQNDFNWNYFCFAKAFNIDKNIFTVSMPCTMVITVESAVKFNV